MTPAGGRILVGMVKEALDRGEVVLRGDRLLKDGQEVRAQLSFERDSGAPSAGLRLSSRKDQDDMSDNPEFAPLPAEVLVPDDKAAAERQRRSQRAALRQAAALRKQRLQWPPKGCAPLPDDRLARKP